WEVWCDGMEVTQDTYFQQCGGFECRPVSAELTYGLERIAMYLQDVSNVYELARVKGVRYGELSHASGAQLSRYARQESDAEQRSARVESYGAEGRRVSALELPLPAYDFALRCGHTFNLLDARGAVSVTERAAFSKRVRDNARLC